jgi:translation elongation factor P/translation initiation factor 5A
MFWMSDDLIVIELHWSIDSNKAPWEIYSTKDAIKIATLSKERFGYFYDDNDHVIIGFFDKKNGRIYPATL